MKKIIKITVILLLIYFAYFFEEPSKEYFFEVEENPAQITNFFIYGTHLNLEGHIELAENYNNLAIILVDDEIIKYDLNYDKDNYFYLSEKINQGINLEKIAEGKYLLFLLVEKEEGEKYFLLENKSEYQNIEYYSLSNEKYIKKMYLDVSEGFSLVVEKQQRPKYVYDFVLDPGHGGLDPGAVVGEHNERDLNLLYAKEMKAQLTELGYRVKLTRENNVDPLPPYGPEGRIQFAYTTKAKFYFSIHFNSSQIRNLFQGVEIYAPPGIDFDFAGQLATNIKEKANTQFSNMGYYKVEDGVYVRTISQKDITEINNSFNRLEVPLYESIDENTPYYFVLRETGGMMTNAYIDGRDPRREANDFYNSNIAPEAYLIEFGYMNHDENLNNILYNKEGYVAGFVKTIKDNF